MLLSAEKKNAESRSVSWTRKDTTEQFFLNGHRTASVDAETRQRLGHGGVEAALGIFGAAHAAVLDEDVILAG